MKTHPPQSGQFHISWKILFGLAESRVPGWERVRGAQIAQLVNLLPVICLTNIINAIVILLMLWGAAPDWQLLGWFGAILAVVASTAGLGQRARSNNAGTTGAVGRATLRAAILGGLWAIPPIYFSGTGTVEQQLAICLVVAGSIAGATLNTSAVPSAMVVFIAIAGGGLAAMMAKTGSPLLITLPLLYALSLGVGGAANGRAFLNRRWAEIALAERNEVVSLLLREFEENGADWLWQTDSSRHLHNVSARLARAGGTDAASLEGTPLLRLLAGDAWERGELRHELKDLLARINARERLVDVDLPVPIRGETRWWRLSAAPRFDEAGRFTGYHGVGSDITEQRRSAEAIDRMARFDALTGLPNRLHFHEAVRTALARAFRERSRCALMLIDLDKFKAVNDSFGHPVGDKLLKIVSQRLQNLIGRGDLCGRLGGDEFAMVVTNATDLGRIDALGTAIIDAMTTPFEIDGNLIHIGASVGTAIGPRDGRSTEMLLRNADLALYRAKDDGRGLHRRFEPSYLVRAEKRRAIELALREALKEGQFRLLYQPVVNADDGRIAGFEALLRWTHPELGDITPNEFIPIAEEARLLTRIGEWVLRTACAEAAGWPRDIRIYVNIAAEQLHDPQLPATILSALSHARIAPSRLELELSEAVFLRDNASAVAALDRIRAIGVRVALDDFGTGYASLGYVQRDRFSTIKIDRSFIEAAAEDAPESLAIIRAAVAMAHTLGVSTTAEGAETLAEHTLARDLGCSQIQGFLTGAPMPSEEARALLARQADRRVA